ncbi:hypothetical protein L6452_10680 [Arctium lappa]|uniref:Uncharacterized protein n=1 Tax=Arctium lappa TaxID=4217 RepID=A0ACB9DN22_ARCLA|nr:hypothetical protein L6452_10680 [Arctium lappa]
MYTSINSLTVVSRHTKPLSLFNSFLRITTHSFHNDFTSPAHHTVHHLLEKCQSMKKLKLIHAQIILHGLHQQTLTISKLISFCAVSEAGDLQYAHLVFDHLPQPNRHMYNSLIRGYANSDNPTTALHLYHQMTCVGISPNEFTYPFVLKAAGIQPDEITFMGLLSACCHSGLTEIGKYYFDRMSSMYGVPLEIEHYACMIDLLGRVGLFGDAIKLIRGMPMKPDVVVWGALLGACRLHGKVEIGKQVLKQVLELEPYTSGVYVLVSNMFSEAGRWEDVKNIRRLMKDQGIKKSRAVSSVEVNGNVYEFMVDDQRKELSSNVYELLDQLMDHLKSFGHFSSSSDTFLNAEKV